MSNQDRLQVVISSAAWAEALRVLATRPGWVASGAGRQDVGRRPPTLLVDNLTSTETPPVGADWAPLATWIVMAMPTGDEAHDPQRWLARLRPACGQRLVILLVGLGADESQWRGWVCERGETRQLGGFQVVGPEFFAAMGEEADKSLAGNVPDFFADEARWQRTVGAVGPTAFERLRQATVVVVGCSRSGTLAASMAASLGVRRLVLFDGDRVESHNLDGMLLATPADVGRNKAEVVAERLAAYRDDLALTVAPRALGARSGEAALRQFDLIVTCVDQDPPRLRAAWLARERLAAHLDIATGVTQVTGADGAERRLAADVRLLPAWAGCVRCVGGLHHLEEAEYLLRAPAGSLPRRGPPAWNAEGRLGSLVTLNSMSVATGVQSWLDLLAGELAGGIWHRIQWQLGAGWRTDSALVASRPDCPLCNRRLAS